MKTIINKILKGLLNTTKGRNALAAAMVKPLMQRMNHTGIARKAFVIKYMCEVCRVIVDKYNLYNKNLTVSKKPKIDHIVGDGTYRVCSKCLKETKQKLRSLNALPIEEMPLYVNDDNIFVKNRSIERLREGE